MFLWLRQCACAQAGTRNNCALWAFISQAVELPTNGQNGGVCGCKNADGFHSFEVYARSMTVKLNHTIVYARDKRASARFFTELFGLKAQPFGPFLAVEVGNEVTLDFYGTEGEVAPQHYAFLVDEAEFDAIFGRLQARGLAYWADPDQRRRGEINRHDGGRGVYFEDPSGHLFEILTRPYGSGSS